MPMYNKIGARLLFSYISEGVYSQARSFCPFVLLLMSNSFIFIIMGKRKQPKQKAPTRSEVIVIRLTPDEFSLLKQKAKDSGKSMSCLGRQALLGLKLYARLTPEQCDSLASLSDARADLVNLRNALKATPEDVKIKIFRNPKFMKEWFLRIDRIANECETVLSKLGL